MNTTPPVVEDRDFLSILVSTVSDEWAVADVQKTPREDLNWYYGSFEMKRRTFLGGILSLDHLLELERWADELIHLYGHGVFECLWEKGGWVSGPWAKAVPT